MSDEWSLRVHPTPWLFDELERIEAGPNNSFKPKRFAARLNSGVRLNMGFTIDQASWHTKMSGNPETRAHIELRFRHLFSFLKKNGLLTDIAPSVPCEQIPDDFMLHSSHLNELGMAVIKEGYDKWLKALDRGAQIEKATALEVALAKVRPS